MRKSVRIFGKKAIPIWLLVLALVACGAGAAAGTVLAGRVTAEIPVAVSQALLVNEPEWRAALPAGNQPQQVEDHALWVALPNRYVGVVSDDNTAFQAAAEMAVGYWAAFNLPLKNASNNELVAELTLNVPGCLEVEVYASTDALNITEVVRTGLNTWKIIVTGDADYDVLTDCLMVVISVDDDCMPGYYNITGTIEQVAY